MKVISDALGEGDNPQEEAENTGTKSKRLNVMKILKKNFLKNVISFQKCRQAHMRNG